MERARRAATGCLMRGRICSSLLLCVAFSLPLAEAHGQKQPDPLSSAQIDQVRELGDRPVERVKLYLKYVNERTEAIRGLTPDSNENSRPMELRARYEEFTRLSDELSDNMETYDADHADLRKALRAVVTSSAKWPPVLEGPAANNTYDFARKTALDAANATIEEAQKLLAAEETYFAAHKGEAGKNGKAPTPEQ
jgi:hypothetical protein